MGTRGNLHALAVSFLLAASAQSGHVEDLKDGSTAIHVVSFQLPDPGRTDPTSRADVAVLAEFVRRYPAIFTERYRAKCKANPAVYGTHNWDRVRVVLEPHRRHRRYPEGTSMAEAARIELREGDAADIVYVSLRASGDHIREGFLHPLDTSEDGYLTSMTDAEKRFAIHPKLLPVVNRHGPDGKKHAWLLPFGGILGRVMLYRKDLLDSRGIPHPTSDWTWEDLLAACRKLTDPQEGTQGIRFGAGRSESWYWTAFLWSAGGRAVEHDPARNACRAVFDSREAAVALDFYTRLCAEPWVDGEGRTHHGYACNEAEGVGGSRWEEGRIGFYQNYVSEIVLSSIDPEVVGMVPMPLGYPDADGKRHRGAELNSRMQGLYAGIKEPAVRDAAWEYIRFQASPTAARIRAEVFVKAGLGTRLNPDQLRLCKQEDLLARIPKGWAEAFRTAIETGRLEPYGPGCEHIYHCMTPPIFEARHMQTLGKLPSGENTRLMLLRGMLREGVIEANRRMAAANR